MLAPPPCKNHPFTKLSLCIAITFEQNMQFQNYLNLGFSLRGNILSNGWGMGPFQRVLRTPNCLNEIIDQNTVCRTAQATPGLLNIFETGNPQLDHLFVFLSSQLIHRRYFQLREIFFINIAHCSFLRIMN